MGFREQDRVKANQRASLPNQFTEEGGKMSKPDFSNQPVATLCQWRADIDECLARLREAEAKTAAIAKANAVDDLKTKLMEKARAGWNVKTHRREHLDAATDQ